MTKLSPECVCSKVSMCDTTENNFVSNKKNSRMHFTNYVNNFKKFYSQYEYNSRREIYNENMESIMTHNIAYDLGKHTYFMSTGP